MTVTDSAFARPEGVDPLAQVQQSIATAPWPWTVEALLELPLRQARSRVPPTVGTLEQRPEGVLLRFGADELEWAARYLVGLGCRFTVCRPPELRQALHRLASELAEDAAKEEARLTKS